ncbi:MAG: IS21-like element helper ATPase IstB [Planctomycetota bacterium]|jgi:DNA replication protein DnaC
MKRNAVSEDLVRGQAKRLKMPGLARSFETLARQAREDGWTHEEFLHEALASEVTSREQSAAQQRVRDARFPEAKTLDGFDFELADGVDRALIAHLAKANWLSEAKNVILAGPIGTGKTHLAIALGVEAARQRRRVLFWRAADLVRALVEAKGQAELGRIHRRLQRAELLIVDELGFVPFDRTGGELLFNLLAERYERRSTIVTTNLAFSEWPKVFGDDEKLTAALLDRLADRATVIATKGKSYRQRRKSAVDKKSTSKGSTTVVEPV